MPKNPVRKRKAPSTNSDKATPPITGGRVRIRMYRQGLGDCFLLSFAGDGNFDTASHVLVDCGTLGATTTGVKIKDVVSDISQTTKGHLALVIATHEHQDHLSGFNSEREAFDAMKVDHSWVAWTEDPNDSLAKKLQKYKGDLGLAAMAASHALSKAGVADPSAKAMSDAMNEVLSFVGDPMLGATFAKGVDAAMKYVASRAPVGNREYLKPGTYLQPSWLPGVTVFVLGPPHDEKKIKNLGEHGNPELYELSDSSVASFGASAKAFTYDGGLENYYNSLSGQDQEQLDASMPFERRYRLGSMKDDPSDTSYHDAKNAWRRIESDWLFSSSDLALQLDNLTNNTSLALPYDIAEDGPVILMPASPQPCNSLPCHHSISAAL